MAVRDALFPGKLARVTQNAGLNMKGIQWQSS